MTLRLRKTEMVQFLALFMAASVVQCQTVQNDASEFCLGCSQRRNHKDLYANPENCHSFYQCFYHSETSASGILQLCPTGTYFHEEVLQCLPEGQTPCVDRCQDPVVANATCYADPVNCRSFFVCDSSASVQLCCPTMTRFNPAVCNCEDDPTCTQPCSQQFRPPTTMRPPTIVEVDLSCRDSFGNLLQLNPDNAESFNLVSEDDAQSFTMACARGAQFSLETCRCEEPTEPIPTEPPSSRKQCELYMPFDEDISDHSSQRFTTYAFGNWKLDQGVYARGGGSLYVNGGRIEIPGLKTYDFGKAASWCFFYKCENWQCATSGILSNRKSANSSEFSIVAGQEYEQFEEDGETFYSYVLTSYVGLQNGQVAKSSFWNKPITMPHEFAPVCIVFDGKTVTQYNPGFWMSWERQNVTGSKVNIGHCPYTIGTDSLLGDFRGWIDEVLVCDHALSYREVNMFYSGRPSLENGDLIPKELPQPIRYNQIEAQRGPNGRKCGHNKYWYNGEGIPPSLAIVGGVEAKPFEFPWFVFLYGNDGEGRNYTCSGTLISKSYVLTLASCCPNAWSSSFNVSAYLGFQGYNIGSFWDPLQPNANKYTAKRGVANTFIHPEFSSDFVDVDETIIVKNNFCLMKLDEPVQLNTWKIQPVCLPQSCESTCQPGDFGSIVGNGLVADDQLSPKGFPNSLQTASVPILPKEVCAVAFKSFAFDVDEASSFCAGLFTKGGVDACFGDQGAPFMCFKNGYFSLDGIISFPTGCGEPETPSLYSKVCAVLDWIDIYLWEDL